MTTDVIIAGKGIAGLVLSVLLKRKGIAHTLLDRGAAGRQLALGETLPPAALPLLQSLGLLEAFERSALHRTYGYHSAWGSSVVVDHNFFLHRPFQYGLKIDKQSLAQELESLTSENILPIGKMTAIAVMHGATHGVTVQLLRNQEPLLVRGRCLVDATGRSRAVLKLLGITSADYDTLLAYSCHLPAVKRPGITHSVFVESFEHGWGLVSRLSEEVQVMSLFNRQRSGLRAEMKSYSCWPAVLSGTSHLKGFLSGRVDAHVVGTDASSSRAATLAGSCWLAIGDAAIAFDPLSSHGIANAVYCAHEAAEAIARHLSDSDEYHFGGYAEALEAIFDQYLATRHELYSRERRWPAAAFWSR